jgi:hypothetical protein
LAEPSSFTTPPAWYPLRTEGLHRLPTRPRPPQAAALAAARRRRACAGPAKVTPHCTRPDAGPKSCQQGRQPGPAIDTAALFALTAVGVGVAAAVADLDTSAQPAIVASAAGSRIVASLSSHMLLRPSARSAAQATTAAVTAHAWLAAEAASHTRGTPCGHSPLPTDSCSAASGSPSGASPERSTRR